MATEREHIERAEKLAEPPGSPRPSRLPNLPVTRIGDLP